MSIKTKKILREDTEIVSMTCSRCEKVVTPDDFVGWQEFHNISFIGGYGSLFGDGNSICIDLCQQCLFELTNSFYEDISDVNEE